MREVTGNLWGYHNHGEWVAITTNGVVNARGECVMGRGVALQAKARFDTLALELGALIGTGGNHVYSFPHYRLCSFPVKHHWSMKADPELIQHSATELVKVVNDLSIKNIYLPRPGCGNGKLNWVDVKPLIEPVFDDRFCVVRLSTVYGG